MARTRPNRMGNFTRNCIPLARFGELLQGVAHHCSRHEELLRVQAELKKLLLQDVDDMGSHCAELESRVTHLEDRIEELTPKNEFGYTQEQCWAMKRILHIRLRHADCPLINGDQDGCPGFAREWISWDWQDYLYRFIDLEKKVQAMEYLMPSAERAAMRDIMREPAESGGVDSLAALSGG